jgi:hypothetical protein
VGRHRRAFLSLPRIRGGLLTLLLVLVSLAVPLKASRPLHVHDAITAGRYNEEHVLASLDSALGDLPRLDAHAALIALVEGACLTAGGARLGVVALDLADSRAPPLA